MAKSKRQNVIQREQNKKGDGTISKTQLISCYIASALIVVLCIAEAVQPETVASGNQALYYLLAVLGVGFSVYITIRNKKAQKKDEPTGRRLS